VLVQALWRPTQIIVLNSATTVVTLYQSCVWDLLSFFEAFLLIYVDVYNFNLGRMGLSFLSIVIAMFLTPPMYMLYVYIRLNPSVRDHGLGPQENRLLPALIACLLPPIGLFTLAWTSSGQIIGS